MSKPYLIVLPSVVETSGDYPWMVREASDVDDVDGYLTIALFAEREDADLFVRVAGVKP